MQLFKKKAYTLYYDEEISLPMDFFLSEFCDGTTLSYIVLDDITGGVAPYYPANVTFSDESTALATTDWSTTPNSGSTAVYYPETVAGVYWISVKDSEGTVFAKVINADCWDSLAADREIGNLSLTGDLNETTACSYETNPMNSIHVAVHTPSTLSIGDRLFLAGTGSTTFDGSTGAPSYTSKYWKISLMTEISPCTGSGTRALIDKDGFIIELYCCP